MNEWNEFCWTHFRLKKVPCRCRYYFLCSGCLYVCLVGLLRSSIQFGGQKSIVFCPYTYLSWETWYTFPTRAGWLDVALVNALQAGSWVETNAQLFYSNSPNLWYTVERGIVFIHGTLPTGQTHTDRNKPQLRVCCPLYYCLCHIYLTARYEWTRARSRLVGGGGAISVVNNAGGRVPRLCTQRK